MRYNRNILNSTKLPTARTVALSRLKIADLERVSGVSRSTVHHYLNLGLLPPPERGGPKLHWYGRAHLDCLRRIRHLKARGLSLSQMRSRLGPPVQPTSVSPRDEKTAEPKRERGPARRRILDTAARLFTEQGYETVHVSDVARAAGVGKATLYQYFKSKSDLFVACLDRLIEVMTATQGQYMAREGSSLATDVERYAAAMIASYPSYRMMVSALGAAAFGDDPKLAARAREAFMRLVTIFEPTLRRAMAEGRCREMDSEMLTYMTWGALMAVGARVTHGDGRYTLLQGMRIYLDFVTHGVTPKRAR